MPLAGWEPAAALVQSKAGPSAARLLYLHSFLALRCDDGGLRLFDFLPLEPSSPGTAVRLLTGRAVPAQLRSKMMSAAFYQGCKHLTIEGVCDEREALSAIEEFNAVWEPRLLLLQRDCNTYCWALLRELESRGILIKGS